MARILNANTDITLGGNNASHEVVPSQKAIKSYIDNKFDNSGVDSALQPEDVASTYSPSGTGPVNGTAIAHALSTLDIPIVDQTYVASSTNAQSGVAIANAGFITNVITALGYTPYNGETNPNNYVNTTQLAEKADSSTITTQTITTLSNGTISLASDCSMYKHTPSATTTYTFDTTNLSLSSNVAYTFELYINMSTTYTLTFPSSVSWLNSETPDFTSAGTYFLAFRTIDGGTNWFGNLQGKW